MTKQTCLTISMPREMREQIRRVAGHGYEPCSVWARRILAAELRRLASAGDDAEAAR